MKGTASDCWYATDPNETRRRAVSDRPGNKPVVSGCTVPDRDASRIGAQHQKVKRMKEGCSNLFVVGTEHFSNNVADYSFLVFDPRGKASVGSLNLGDRSDRSRLIGVVCKRRRYRSKKQD